MIKLCIFDLDDTLISTKELYEERKHNAAHILKKMGFNYDEAYALQVEIDQEAILKDGVMDLNRFPNSFRTTYERLCEKYDLPYDSIIGETLVHEGAQVFQHHASVYPYTVSILEELNFRGYTANIILTRGNKTIQLRRVLDANLADYFDNIFVVDYKTKDLLEKICSFYNVNPTEAVLIGDSMIGDILPAMEAGLFGIYVPKGTSMLDGGLQLTPTEETFPSKLFIRNDLRDVPSVLKRIHLNG